MTLADQASVKQKIQVGYHVYAPILSVPTNILFDLNQLTQISGLAKNVALAQEGNIEAIRIVEFPRWLDVVDSSDAASIQLSIRVISGELLNPLPASTIRIQYDSAYVTQTALSIPVDILVDFQLLTASTHIQLTSTTGGPAPASVPLRFLSMPLAPTTGDYSFSIIPADAVSWLAVTLNNGGTQHELHSTTASLPAGAYAATLVVSSAATGIRLNYPVALTVTNNTVPDPVDDCGFVAGKTFQTLEKYELGSGPFAKPGYWTINFTTTGTFSHRYSDVAGRGHYNCNNNGLLSLLNAAGGQYQWGASVDAVNNRVNVPFDIGRDRYYYLVL